MKGSTATLAIVGVLAISYLPYVTLSMPTTTNDAAPKFQLNYIGSADGKSFFAEEVIPLNWTDASQFCKNSSMQLASITSVAQQNVLKNATNFTGTYWIGGRDSQTHAQFAWESNEAPINPTLAGPFYYFSTVKTCVFYHAGTNIKKLGSNPCTGTLGTLCEITA